ncbi:GGDEF domain-containing protein [Leucothrix sargassi]|nr:GGDEF domain-containing protein [Leucothrix sargassi]
MNTRTHTEVLILIACLLGFAGIMPFAIYRFFINDYIMFAFDGLVALTSLGLFAYVWLTRKYKLIGAIISVVYLLAALSLTYINGPNYVHWAYPAAIAGFCLVSSRLAIFLSFSAILGIFFILKDQMLVDGLVRVITTLTLLSLFGYIFNDSVHRQRKFLSTLAARDALTGAWNRRTMDETLIQTTSSNNRNPLIASLIILDIDHFKKINDTYGHTKGDEILAKLAHTINDSIRLSDRLFRYGGEEFIIIADGAKLENAAILAESIRKRIEHSAIFPKEKITISLGIAGLEDGQSPEDWLKSADEALYEAKRTGRNKVCLAKAPASHETERLSA